MRILITGGTGMIGRALAKMLLAEKYSVWALTRSPQKAYLPEGVEPVGWDGRTPNGWQDLISQIDVIINLAGENLAGGLWTKERKRQILESRVSAGRAVAEAIRMSSLKPKVLIQASGIGYYGPHGDEPVTEVDLPGNDFLADVCQVWEASSQLVEELGVRRVVIRSAVVLTVDEGILPLMTLPIRFFIGGPLGNGLQGVPWIHIDDEVAAIRFLIENEKACGAFNLVAPGVVSNADFNLTLTKVLQRPYWLPVPSFALRLVLGEMSTLVVDGQFAQPKRLIGLGYQFRFEKLENALSELFQKNTV